MDADIECTEKAQEGEIMQSGKLVTIMRLAGGKAAISMLGSRHQDQPIVLTSPIVKVNRKLGSCVG